MTGGAPWGVSKGATRLLERRRSSEAAKRPQRSPLLKQTHEDLDSLIINTMPTALTAAMLRVVPLAQSAGQVWSRQGEPV